MDRALTQTRLDLRPGADYGSSQWLRVDQALIDKFADATLDPDPMHVDPVWAREKGPFGSTVAFGFLTMSLLTYFMHDASRTDSAREPSLTGYYLNYGFDRLRLVEPVRVGNRIRGTFKLKSNRTDERKRQVLTFDSVIEIEGNDRPALVAEWLSVHVPPEAVGGA